MARLKGMLAGISPMEIDPPLTPTVQGSWPRAASLLALVGTCASGAGTERRLLPLLTRLLEIQPSVENAGNLADVYAANGKRLKAAEVYRDAVNAEVSFFLFLFLFLLVWAIRLTSGVFCSYSGPALDLRLRC